MFKEIVTKVEFSGSPVDHDFRDFFRVESRLEDSKIRFEDTSLFLVWHTPAEKIKLLRWMADEIEVYANTEISE